MNYSCIVHGWQHAYNPCPNCGIPYSTTNQSQCLKTDRDLLIQIQSQLNRIENEIYKLKIEKSLNNIKLKPGVEEK